MAHTAAGLDTIMMRYDDHPRADSLEDAYRQHRDSVNRSNLEAEKRDAGATAREAQRVEGEAADAAIYTFVVI